MARTIRNAEGQKLVVARSSIKVDQHAPVFQDRRTKRQRDRSTQRRLAIRESAA